MTGQYLEELSHPRIIAGTALAALTTSFIVAVARPLPSWELRLTEAVNDVPDVVGWALYPVMQLGTIGGSLAVAVAIAVFVRDRVLSSAVLLTAIVTWLVAKGVKRLVDRDRPLAYLPDLIVREGAGTGLGYASGHSAVAASVLIMAMVAIPSRWRPAAAGVVGLVGVARIVYGVHLPADVVGGWGLGVLLGLGGLALACRVRPSPSSAGASVREP